MPEESNTFRAFSDQFARAVKKAGESTVLVDSRQRFPASGIAYAANLIVTAEHVVERDEGIFVILANGERLAATVAGRDPGNDIAVLRLEKDIAAPAERASREAQVGEIVLALGRPSQAGIEASLGIISAIGGPARTGRGGLLEQYIRTDTIPYPGFSGGPLVDTEGKVVGLNTSGFAHGAAITIPASIVWLNAENLAKFGYTKRGYLGIRSQTVALSAEMRKLLEGEQETGLLLVAVEEGTPAEKGGLMVGDILVAINGNPIHDHDDLFVHLAGDVVGKPASLQVLRGGKPVNITVTIGERR